MNNMTTREIKCELYNDNFQNYKRYNIPKAQLVIADIPYNIGNNFYGSNPMWYVGGDNANGESNLAGKAAFNTDFNFNLAEYFHFCGKLLKKEPKKGGERGRSSDAPCMVMFCSFEQQAPLIELARKHGYAHYIPLVFIKNYSPQVLKANMRICGATEYGLLFYRGYLPKFRNNGQMVFNWFNWQSDEAKRYPKLHPAQKPVALLKRIIEILTDPGDVVIDPVAGSGSTLRAAWELGRSSYGFECWKDMYKRSKETMLNLPETRQIGLFEVMQESEQMKLDIV